MAAALLRCRLRRSLRVSNAKARKLEERRAERNAPRTTTAKEEAALGAAILFVTESSKLDDRRKIDDDHYALERKTTAKTQRDLRGGGAVNFFRH